MIGVLRASVLVLALTHMATLGLLAVDLRRARPVSGWAAGLFASGAAVAAAAAAAGSYSPRSA